ncbi:TAP-like protein [Kribbella sp. VKM Ac-2569]|uniref:alpha/beta fold hydrolase n=1 Tax=Kribbella sp. VKM Ac-2569 TaxID=2512220 RepID=UPI00102C0569|nr:alpha/beta hydrolase [Kribbella sp. VKM Ac-2569]RZT17455.1 TAP-like protein [Kribbella sp. VKM Ac-2569]
MPTLVVGGSDDPFFPEPVLRATADALPPATLRIYPGHGHGLPKHRARQLQHDIHTFLTHSAPL